MAQTVLLKRSSVVNKVPLGTDLTAGELAVNLADKRLYSKDGSGNVIQVGGDPSAFKQAVRVATTANITLSGTQTIDGVSVVANDRVLVKDQSTTGNNGIYIAASSTWTRASDMDTAAEAGSAVVAVQSGTTNGGTLWWTTFKSTDTVGTSAMSWTKVGTSSGTGDVVGPSSSTANAVALFDGTTGKLLKDSAKTLPTGTVVGTSDTQTLTNKRVDPRVSSTASISSPLAWNSDSYDLYAATGQTAALTLNADAGTPVDGQRIMFRFKDNGTTRTLTFTGGASKAFRPVGVTLTTSGSNYTYATTASKAVYFGCVYNADAARWDIVALSLEA